jgi:tRNA 2-thiouridine synthesizing protein E
MPPSTLAGTTVRRDLEGYFLDPHEWTQDMAIYIARENGVQVLTDLHWRIINFVRETYLETGVAPTLRALTMDAGLSVPELRQLFPRDPARLAAKIAGLPKPRRAF